MTIEEINKRLAEIGDEINAEDADVDALSKEVEELEAKRNALKANAEKRAIIAEKIARGAIGTVIEKNTVADEEEKRANEFVKTGRMEIRALLSTGTIAKPTKVGGISGLAEVPTEIVDDVHSFSLTGNGTWSVGYKKSDAAAADVTDGNAIGGTAATFGTVDINPSEWGIYDTISNQVKKINPLDYKGAITDSSLTALREKAAEKIVNAVLASKLTEKKAGIALDENYLRDLTLGYSSVKSKGPCKLYLTRKDLQTLGKVRGTQDKKAVYTITFEDDTNNFGKITEGGTAVNFRVLDKLTAGTQLFGQPGAIDMPMWDNYEIATDESELFSKNLIAIRGLQTAGADLVVYHGMQVITQSAVAA